MSALFLPLSRSDQTVEQSYLLAVVFSPPLSLVGDVS
ncbi:hypothetical protein AVEN_123150-1, partial [Araneus ventricosus]